MNVKTHNAKSEEERMANQQHNQEIQETPTQHSNEAEAKPAWLANEFLGLPFPDLS